MNAVVVRKNEKYEVTVIDLYSDDFKALTKLLEQSDSPQFKALAVSIKNQAEYYVVEVQRTEPYTESVYHEIADLVEATRFAKEQANLFGVSQVLIWDSEEGLLDTFVGGEN